MSRRRLAAVLPLLLCLGCDDEEPAAPTTGSLEIVGSIVGEVPEGAKPSVALFGCPFQMPPTTTAGGTITGDQVQGRVDDLAPGEICVLAFLDADRDDGVMPINGLDLVAYPPEGQDAFPVQIVAGETTRLEVVFELRGDVEDPVDPPGPDDVWIRLKVTCPTCTSTMPIVFYGYKGEQLGTIPDLYNKYSDSEETPVAFPFEAIIQQSGILPGPLTAQRVIVLAYQDVDGVGMKPGEDEPQSESRIVDLVAGAWNDLTLELK